MLLGKKRWALSFNLRTQIALQTMDMHDMGREYTLIRNEAQPARQRRDQLDEQKVIDIFNKSKVFSPDSGDGCMHLYFDNG